MDLYGVLRLLASNSSAGQGDKDAMLAAIDDLDPATAIPQAASKDALIAELEARIAEIKGVAGAA